MATINCTDGEHLGKNGKCCDRCPAGQYKRTDCDSNKKTICAQCASGYYTATINYLPKCRKCMDCSEVNNHVRVKECTTQNDAVCGCMSSFYCTEEKCEHCKPATRCALGSGVRVQATHPNDTICAPCEVRTYSNKSDFSACLPHTRCENLGREYKTSGTRKTDAICGDFISHCHWMLPASLWSGLVLTALILFCLVCWRGKRKSYKPEKKEKAFLKPPFKTTGDGSISISLMEMFPAAPFTQLQPLPQNGHCQENSKLPLFNPEEDYEISCSTQDSVNSYHPITPLKASVSFAESTHTNGSAGYCTGILRTVSEPQEDEWCGT
ncbi:tumor necrosis factor receptor superfamily member 5 isoform X1 [Trematomus bernacchii]|uniref:tumor necrosis factor receptor superfamily member 5 isoform X1 n=1 Tax=Trematomus bernacchii TaxID=40690 RepID=UPI00146AD496|nr:tumor necrosis factor receptor superfamily member 5 isoform X1 [Trematomus bernacchii]